MEIYCLDAEFTENEELLELSVYNLEGTEVYHDFYRPVRIKDWRTDIHHITPEMVADKAPFSESREKVESLLCGAYALTGFALENDLRVLEASGVRGLREVRVMDVKDMYWYMRGREKGMNPFSVPSLLICANSLGLHFGEDEAHSASADTEATLRCFNLLWDEFRKGEGADVAEDECMNLLSRCIEKEKGNFVEETAKGYVKVIKTGPYHKIKFGHKPDEPGSVLFEVEVADRYKAEYELRKLLKKKEVPGKIGVYKLSAKLLEDIKGYSNQYDAEESAWCKKVVRNLGRLTL